MGHIKPQESVPARYKCMSCGYFVESSKPLVGPCMKCNHIYVEWLNYDEYIKGYQNANHHENSIEVHGKDEIKRS